MIAIALMIALLFYAFLAWAVVRFVGWLGRICTLTPVTTKASQAFCASVFVLLPTWDIIPGWIYFTHLCDSQAEVKILRTVDLAEKYFLPNGQVDGQKVGDKFKGLFSSDKEFSPLLHIEKRETVLQDSITGEMLGSTREFVYRGGWVARLILPDGRYVCRQYQQSSAHIILWREVIRPKKDLKLGGN